MISHDSLDIKKKALAASKSRTILAIDSSTQWASISVLTQNTLVYNEECLRQKSHSEWINGAIERAITVLKEGWSNVDLISVCRGPGSFTGLRVATNVAKAISFARNIPLVSYSSLEILAVQSSADASAPFILPVINAFKNKVFFSLYQKIPQAEIPQLLIEPSVVDVENLTPFLMQHCSALKQNSRVEILGDGVLFFPDYFQAKTTLTWVRTPHPKDYPLAQTLAQKTASEWLSWSVTPWRELNPSYLRGSAAEENRFTYG